MKTLPLYCTSVSVHVCLVKDAVSVVLRFHFTLAPLVQDKICSIYVIFPHPMQQVLN